MGSLGGVGGAGKRVIYLVYCLGSKGCLVCFPKVHCKELSGVKHPLPQEVTRSLYKNMGTLVRYVYLERNKTHLQISVSLMILSERLKCFTWEVKFWQFLRHEICIEGM